jgi:hypothetical protein
MLPFIRYFERGAPDVPPKKRKNRESGGKHNPCVVRVQRRFVSLHGTIKRVELRVLSVGLRENPGAVRIAIAARQRRQTGIGAVDGVDGLIEAQRAGRNCPALC